MLDEALLEGWDLHLDLVEEPSGQANRAGLELALRHLLDNACDALPDGGTITVATRPWPAPPSSRSAWPTRAWHAGGGLERAVEPRFSTRPKGQASGLGLTIVDRVVRTLGGEVRIESAVGSGTTVRLQLAGATTDG